MLYIKKNILLFKVTKSYFFGTHKVLLLVPMQGLEAKIRIKQYSMQLV